ncbi:MAG: response regulator transcription factor [Saprospiraceae bacterium]|nr:response regulator transcription factor [Saprospiraceae bacterium]
MQNYSVVIADSQFLTRQGLVSLLSGRPEIKVLSEATDEEELMEQLRSVQPDLIIVDYNQDGHFSSETIPAIRKSSPGVNILVISADNDKKSIYNVLEAGVSSFLTKTCGEEEIIDAIYATAKGEKFFCTKVIDYLLEKSFTKEKEEDCSPTPLSPREVEILQLVAKGLIAKEIAHRLNLSPHTVYTHRKNIMRKLNLNTSSELVLYAVNEGYVDKN